MSKSLTIVLPVYNAESKLRKNVTELLELASELTTKFGVLIIDDGSTDATIDVAGELAVDYPQVMVRRHRHRRGLGAAIDYVQRRVRSDAVMVHDGVTPVNPQQMRNVWHSWIAHSTATTTTASPEHWPPNVREFSHLPAAHAKMEQVHRRMLGFQIISSESSVATATELASPIATKPKSRPDASHLYQRQGIGQIPPMPRPKFLTALAAFALGE